MSSWSEIRAAAQAALAQPRDAREAFLDRTCGNDAVLRAEVEAQIRFCEAAERSEFLSVPAATFVAPLFGDLTADEVLAGPEPAPTGSATEGGQPLDAVLRVALAGRYELEREIGRGGAATVYLARDLRHERRVAIKVLDPAIGAALSGARFLREIRVTAALTHPHILPLHDSGETDGRLYYVMPFVEGETLRERLAREPMVALDVAVRILRDIASALACAHRQGVVHRDIKPANILLEDDHAVVADFGIARAVGRARAGLQGSASSDTDASSPVTLTDGGASPGTPAYMAPEQAAAGAIVDHRADIYSLGVVAYEMLAGAHPFGRRAPRAMIEAHRDESPPSLVTLRPDVPEALSDLVMRCLEKDPTRRPQTAAAILGTIEKTHVARSARRQGSRRRLAGIGIVTALALFAVGAAIMNRREVVPRASTVAADARGTNDQETYDLYLKGRYFWLQRGSTNVARSIAYFQQAVARDPSFARAHAGLALAYAVLPNFANSSSDSTTALTFASAQRALALDSTLADAQLALGIALDLRLQFLDALEHYRVAVTLDPSSATAHHWIGFSLLNLGRTDEALVHLRHAAELDPLSVEPASAAATGLLYARRFRESEDEARRALVLDSTSAFAIWTLGLAQAFGGQPDSAVATLERGSRLHPADPRLSSALVFSYAAAGRMTDAARLRTHLRDGKGAIFDGTEAPLAALVFGDREPLVRVLSQKAGQLRYIRTGGAFGCNPLLDPLWSDARFQRAMRTLAVSPCPLARPWPIARQSRS